jgi:hypothetical protein
MSEGFRLIPEIWEQGVMELLRPDPIMAAYMDEQRRAWAAKPWHAKARIRARRRVRIMRNAVAHWISR